MSDTITIIAIVLFGLVIVLAFFKKTKFRIGAISGDLDYEIEPVIPMTETRKPQLCQFPDGYARYVGAKRNNNGRYDLHFTDDEVRINVDPDKNILFPDNILAVLAGTSTVLINVTKDGDIIPWGKLLGMKGMKDHKADYIEELERKARTYEIKAKTSEHSTKELDSVERQADSMGRIRHKISTGGSGNRREEQVDDVNEDEWEEE